MGYLAGRYSIRWKAVTLFSSLAILVIVAGLLGSCGTSRKLISVTVEPGTAIASAPGGTAVFSVTGTFNSDPVIQTNLPATWSSSDANSVTVDGSGVAKCVAGGDLSVTVTASVDQMKAYGILTCQSSGSASAAGAGR
jgi:hypothetical protein